MRQRNKSNNLTRKRMAKICWYKLFKFGVCFLLLMSYHKFPLQLWSLWDIQFSDQHSQMIKVQSIATKRKKWHDEIQAREPESIPHAGLGLWCITSSSTNINGSGIKQYRPTQPTLMLSAKLVIVLFLFADITKCVTVYSRVSIKCQFTMKTHRPLGKINHIYLNKNNSGTVIRWEYIILEIRRLFKLLYSFTYIYILCFSKRLIY